MILRSAIQWQELRSIYPGHLRSGVPMGQEIEEHHPPLKVKEKFLVVQSLRPETVKRAPCQ